MPAVVTADSEELRPELIDRHEGNCFRALLLAEERRIASKARIGERGLSPVSASIGRLLGVDRSDIAFALAALRCSRGMRLPRW